MSSTEIDIIKLNNLAEQKRQLGDKAGAGELFRRAIQTIANHGASARTEASVCTNFGLLLSSVGRHDEAVKLQHRALELDLNRKASPGDLGYSYHNLGFALMGAGKAEEGLPYLLKARDFRRSIRDHKELAMTLEALGETCLALDRLDQAVSFAQEGRALAEVLGHSPTLRGVLSVLASVAERQQDYKHAVELHGEILDLLEQLRSAHKDYDHLDLFDSRYNKRYLAAIELFLKAGRFAAALAAIDRSRFRSACDMLEGIREFGSPLSAESIVLPELHDDELILVEWIYTKFDWSFPISAWNRDVTARKILTSEREGAPVELDLDTEWRIHFANTLRQTQRVIDAYEAELPQISRIVIMPHGTQWQTPFAALVHPRTRKLLQETHEVLVSPSLRYCHITDPWQRIASTKHLVFGDPTNDLPAARKESEAVAQMLGCKPLIGGQATRGAVMQALTRSEFDVVHFAGHGIFTETGLTALMLADGVLTADDVRSCEFKANLVNLASCWGGMATFTIWNELHGFVRALLCTGTRNIIGSVYPLGDKAAMTFSKAFYEERLRSVAHPCTLFRRALMQIPPEAPVTDWGGLYVTGQR